MFEARPGQVHAIHRRRISSLVSFGLNVDVFITEPVQIFSLLCQQRFEGGIGSLHEKEQADGEHQEVRMDSQLVNVLKMSQFMCFLIFFSNHFST